MSPKCQLGANNSDYSKNYKSDPIVKLYDSCILDALFCGVLAINKLGTIIAFNYSAEFILKVRKEKVLGKNIKDIEGLLEFFKVISLHNGQGRHKVKLKGSTIILNLNPLKQKESTIGTLAIFHKSSAVECINQELDVTENLLKEINTILESSYDGMYITDDKGRVIKLNAAFERIFSVSRKDILGKKVQQLIKEGIYSKSAVLNTLDTLQTYTVMYENNGRKILATSTPIFNEKGKIHSVVVNVRDITELENLKLQLEYQQKLTEKYSYALKKLRENKHLFPDVIMQSKKMQEVMDIVKKVAEVDSNVLVTGESGVGKDIVVQYIHKLSHREQGGLIKINCGAIPPTLLESELFGYEPGAFTGARSKGKMGLFELAHEGTLFLDEIGEMNLGMQVKLLRAIQEKEITRVGGTETIKIDVRIVAATNRNLRKMMSEGKFREDLFYRLNVINISVPPLRERREDINPLLLFNLDKFNKKYNKSKYFAEETANILNEYSWPGNIRELENLVENLVVLVQSDKILPAHLPESIFSKTQSQEEILVKGIMPLKKAVEMVEYQIINNAKQKYNTTRQMAKILGVDQSTIVRKMQKYCISDE